MLAPSLRVNAAWLIPTPNQDIERIEVVLGPAAALYGPNAAAGVLHYLWLVKKDVSDPIYWAAALLVVLALRFVRRPERRLAPVPLSPEGGAR